MLKRIIVLMIIATLSLGSFKYAFADETTNSDGTETTVNGEVGPGTISESGAAGASSTGAGAAAGAASGTATDAAANSAAGAAGAASNATDAESDPENMSGQAGSGSFKANVVCQCGLFKGFFNPICNITCAATKAIVEFMSWVGSLFDLIPE